MSGDKGRARDDEPLQKLRESGELFRLFVENVRDYALISLSVDGRIVTWNAGAERIKGYSAAEIIGQHFSVFYTDEDRRTERFAKLLDIAAREGRVQDEGLRVRKDGSRFWANVVITALRDQSGRLVGFGKMTRDLTERRRAEEELRQSEERFRLIVGSVRDYAIFMLSPEGNVLTWNAGAERIKGYTEREIVGSHFSRFYPEEEVRSGKCEYELAVAAREGRFEDEGYRIRKDGSRFWANVIISAVRNAEGVLVGFSKVTRDLTDRKTSEEERIKLAHAEEAVRLRDEFLSIASHELKTPLTSLRLQLQSLAQRALDEKAAHKVERASRSADRLASLVETVLDVSRISTGRLALSYEQVELRSLATDVCDRLAEQAEAIGARIEVRGSEVVGTWDRLRVEQIVANLVTNAIKYAGAKPVTVHVSAVGDDALMVVEDRGPGIAEADRQRIFERFERAVSLRHFAGLGLGLYVSREIALAHGGAIDVENAPEGGARFSVWLPRRRVERRL